LLETVYGGLRLVFFCSSQIEGKKWDGRERVYCQCLERLVLHLILLGLGVFPEWLLFDNTAPWDIAAILVFYWTSCCLY
jgi:hypothetical protein